MTRVPATIHCQGYSPCVDHERSLMERNGLECAGWTFLSGGRFRIPGRNGRLLTSYVLTGIPAQDPYRTSHDHETGPRESPIWHPICSDQVDRKEHAMRTSFVMFIALVLIGTACTKAPQQSADREVSRVA